MRAHLDAMDEAWEALGGAPAEKQVMLATLGPRMLQFAGERTLGVFPYNVTPAHAAISRQQVGAHDFVCSEQKVCLTSESDEARAASRAAMKHYLPLPNYIRNWFLLGFDESDLENGGSDRLMDAMANW